MEHFNVAALIAGMAKQERRYHEFLRVPSLSMGVYRLKAGETDPQSPHTEDEVYLVISGRAAFRAGGEERQVSSGDVLFVERSAEHRFVDIREDLTLLVFFAPAEGSAARPHIP
jgi:mannose-6-phosphate isomerase-like protein (cupin superfamily)